RWHRRDLNGPSGPVHSATKRADTPGMDCVICDEPCDQPGRFCTRCVGSRAVVQPSALQLGPAQVALLKVLQWPISLLLLGATALAGMRTMGLAINLQNALHADSVAAPHLADVQQHVVLAGAALVTAVAALWMVWWGVGCDHLRAVGARARAA